MGDTLDSQAAAYASLLALSGDPGAAFRTAVALADGLFPHQIEGVAFLLGRRRAILADDMGLGKTRQSILSLRHLTPGGHRLVVCPASVKRKWAREVAIVAPDASVLVIEGAAPVALTAEWVVMNYEILARHNDQLLRVSWAALVFDEAHYLKNHTSARSRLARQLTAAAAAANPALAVQLLTGTPLTSRSIRQSVTTGRPKRASLAYARRGMRRGVTPGVGRLRIRLVGAPVRRPRTPPRCVPRSTHRRAPSVGRDGA